MTLHEIFRRGLENDAYLGARHNCSQRIKIFIFILGAVLFSRKNKTTSPNIAWINGNRGYEKMIPEDDHTEIVFHGSSFINISNFKSKNSVLSIFDYSSRFRILLKAFQEYRGMNHKATIMYWLEFYLIYSFLLNSGVNKVFTTGIYDRQTTWIAYVCCDLGLEFEIIQHGLVDNTILPNRIPCTRVKTVNDHQIDLLKHYVILNDTCEYEITEFISTVNFSLYPNKEGILIGVATQCYPDIMNSILDNILKVDDDFTIILMLHPLEKKDAYMEYLKYDNIIIEREKKYINLDIMVTQHSTIVYDYIANGFKGRLVQIDPKDSFCALDGIEELIRMREFSEIPDVIGKILDEIREEKQGDVQE